MFQRFHDSFFFLWQTFRLFGIFKFWFIITFSLYDSAFLLYLCKIQVSDFQSALLQNIILDFLIDGFALLAVRSSSSISNFTLICFNLFNLSFESNTLLSTCVEAVKKILERHSLALTEPL